MFSGVRLNVLERRDWWNSKEWKGNNIYAIKPIYVTIRKRVISAQPQGEMS